MNNLANKLMDSIKTVVLLFCAAFIFAACSKKNIPTLPLPPKSIDIQEIDFEYFHGKARLNFKDNTKEREVKAHIRIRKDSVIWMTFTVIGVQGGKALINKDSITIVSSLNKEYYVFDYKELSKRFNFKIDFYVIQAAMLGNLIVPKHSVDNVLEEEIGTGHKDNNKRELNLDNFKPSQR